MTLHLFVIKFEEVCLLRKTNSC